MNASMTKIMRQQLALPHESYLVQLYKERMNKQQKPMIKTQQTKKTKRDVTTSCARGHLSASTIRFPRTHRDFHVKDFSSEFSYDILEDLNDVDTDCLAYRVGLLDEPEEASEVPILRWEDTITNMEETVDEECF
jgi:hypothetical protein